MRRHLGRLRRDRRGVTAVEFAIIATPMMIAFLGLVDLGFRQYMAAMLQGAMDQAARRVTVGGVSEASINTFVDTRMKTVLGGSNTVVVPLNYGNFSKVGRPEPITADANNNNVLDPGDCFTDLNGNGRRDMDGGKGGNGVGDDVVYYVATSTYPAIMPLRGLLGWDTTTRVTATMMMRNQPYSAQSQPATVCI